MLKVFIVDDDDIIRQGLQVIVKKFVSDCEVIGEASDGELALEAIKLNKPDLLITDIKMPIMDGTELIKNIKELDLNIKVIVLSGFDEYRYVRETFKYGVKDYLLKPIQKKDIIELINKVKLEIEKEAELQLKAKEVSNLLGQKLIMQLVQKSYDNIIDIEDELRDLGIEAKGDFILTKISIDNYFKADLNKYSLKHFVSDFEIMCKPTLKYIDNSSIIALFQGDSHWKLREFQNNIARENTFTITIAVSNNFHDIYHTHIAVEQARLAAQGGFYKGNNYFLEYEAENNESTEFGQFAIDSYVQSFIESIEICNSKKAVKCMEEFLTYLRTAEILPSEFRKCCLTFINRIIAGASDFREVLNDADMNLYLKELNTYEEIKEYLLKEVFSISEEIKDIRTKKSKKIIEISKKYVLTHFNEDINLNLIADKVFLNPNYFSNLFKAETGMNFSDFLLEVRINEAKRLLANPEYKIYEIGPMVGYEETVSFGRAFKKKVGLSPSDYRNIIK